MGGAKLEKKRNKKSTWTVSDGLKEVFDSEIFYGKKKQKLIQKEVVEVVATYLKKKQMDKGADEAGKADFGLVEETRNNRDESVQKKKVKKSRKEHPKTGSKVEDAIQSAAAESEGVAVTVSGSRCTNPKFKPLTSFDIPGVPENVLACCKKFHRPSPIQAHAWPFLLAGRDLIGVARTGSGKTLAFGVPAVVNLLNKKVKLKKPWPLALVLAPTGELTQQIGEVLQEAGSFCGVKIACIYGGASKGPQKESLRAGAMIILATPGRLQDLLEEGVCSLDLVSFVVLDDPDRLLDLGFEPSIRAILNGTPTCRQTLMFSATWPVSVDNLGKDFLQDSSRIVKVIVGSEDLTANHDVTQIVEVIDEKDRIFRLESLLRKYDKSRIKEAAWGEGLLLFKGWKAVAVHGDKGQSDRTQAVKSFKDGSCPLLVATDVAARGLDIPDVEYVINFSFPLTIEDYVHRIGRTGRAGKKGIAHTFFTQSDKESPLYGAHFKGIGASAKQSTKTTFGNSDNDD